ncbi:MAG: hypothetical protein C1943_08500 [Halochromatium sp.]|nr:hypothetical protein [Halochromatium sp.]
MGPGCSLWRVLEGKAREGGPTQNSAVEGFFLFFRVTYAVFLFVILVSGSAWGFIHSAVLTHRMARMMKMLDLGRANAILS